MADLIGGRGTRSGGLDVVSLSDHRRGPAARVPRGGGGTHAETGRVHARPQRGGGARGRGECIGGDTMRPGRVPREARGERRRMPLRRPRRSDRTCPAANRHRRHPEVQAGPALWPAERAGGERRLCGVVPLEGGVRREPRRRAPDDRHRPCGGGVPDRDREGTRGGHAGPGRGIQPVQAVQGAASQGIGAHADRAPDLRRRRHRPAQPGAKGRRRAGDPEVQRGHARHRGAGRVRRGAGLPRLREPGGLLRRLQRPQRCRSRREGLPSVQRWRRDPVLRRPSGDEPVGRAAMGRGDACGGPPRQPAAAATSFTCRWRCTTPGPRTMPPPSRT